MNLFRSIILAIFLFLIATSQVQAQQERESLNTNQIDALIQKYYDARLFHGSALVAEGDNIVYQRGFGEANIDWGIPNSPDTRFRIGSVTKQFTAALILQLVEEGKIDLDGKITDYAPDYPAGTGDRITIHQLLTHTSGIPNFTALPGFMSDSSRDPYEPDSFLTVFSVLDLDFEPGEQLSYSNSGYFLLGVIIEKVSGLAYEDALQSGILDPLGLENTGYDHFDKVIEQRATGYSKSPLGFQPAAYLDTSIPYAAGMMYSTVGDLFKWTRALHTGEVFENPETLQKMITPYTDNYGYGLNITEDSLGGRLVKRISHGGGIHGFSAWLEYMPQEEYSVVTLDNAGLSAGAGLAIAELLYGEPIEQPVPDIADVIGRTISEDGVAAAIELYNELKSNQADAYNFGEGQLNRLGYYYLSNGDIEVAIEVFELNVSAFPEAANPYDSLGEAFLEAGKNELAIQNYTKSLELNPGNTTAKEVLTRFGIEFDEETYEVSRGILESYVGDYELQPNFIISVSIEGRQIFAQATGQDRFEMFATSDSEFYLKVVDAQITFNRDDSGAVESLTMHQNGQHIPGKKMN